MDRSTLRTAETRQCVLAAFAEQGPKRLRTIYDALEGSVSSGELHILRVYVLCRDANRQDVPD